MQAIVANFHFLRPELLWLLAPIALVYFLTRRREEDISAVGKMVAPHLRRHLLIGGSQRARFRPVHLVTVCTTLGTLGAAGPAWEHEPTPFTEDQAPMAIVLDLSSTMNAIDVQPTRVERAKQKIRDLLVLRKGARTSLFVYAGSAHSVTPLTDDASLFELYLAALDPILMPNDGEDATAALQAATDYLEAEPTPGTILFVTDGVEEKHFGAFSRAATEGQDQILVLAVGTPEGGPIKIGKDRFLADGSGRRVTARLDVDQLNAFRSETGIQVTSLSLDGDDVEWIQRRTQSHLVAAQEDNPNARWRDFGYYFTFPVGGLALFWFRRGWTIRWSFLFLCGAFLLQPSTSQAQSFRFIDLWMTPDQQGRYYFEDGEYAVAAERFADPLWKGIAHYRAENWSAAIDQFARLNSAEAAFYLGNCYARSGELETAVTAYQEALEQQSGFPEADANLSLVQSLIPAESESDGEEAGDPTFDPDEIKFDDKGKKGKEGEVPQMKLSEEQLAEIWMRSIQVSPADFLRAKFYFQDERKKAAASPEGAQ